MAGVLTVVAFIGVFGLGVCVGYVVGWAEVGRMIQRHSGRRDGD